MLWTVFASVEMSSEDETSSVMSWSMNWPAYVMPASMVESAMGASRPGAAMAVPSAVSRPRLAAVKGNRVALRVRAVVR